MITGAARVAGVVGWPVAHSLSPLIHNAWIEALGLDAVYVPFAVPPAGFEAFIRGLDNEVVRGLNVTLPHKLAAFRLAGEVSEQAVRTRSANLLTFEKTGVYGRSTDGEGLVSAIAAACPPEKLRGSAAVVLGAGGAAQAAVGALLDYGASDVRVVARRKEAAYALATTFEGDAVSDYGFGALGAALTGAGLVVNATAAGLNGEGELPPMDAAPREAVFMDMVYKPLLTQFLRDAAARGHLTVDGLAMLIGQARPSFEAFFGVAPPPEDVVNVRALCLRALGETA
jgi:shikimate dehydrogenase